MTAPIAPESEVPDLEVVELEWTCWDVDRPSSDLHQMAASVAFAVAASLASAVVAAISVDTSAGHPLAGQPDLEGAPDQTA